MAHSQENFEEERFVNPVPDNLCCAICFGVLQDPMQCVKNEHSFCKSCIKRYVQNTPKCPNCIEPLTLQTLRPSRLAKDMVSQLLVHCNHSNRGCPDNVKLETLQHHVTNCKFRPVQCPNEGCEVVTNKIDQLNHQRNKCGFRLSPCLVCGKQVSYWKRKVHCYVTRQEMDKMKKSLKETKDEMSEVKQIVKNLSRELMSFMGELKHDIAGIKGQIRDIKGEFEDVKDEIGGMKGEIVGMKGEVKDVKGTIGGIQGEVQDIKGEIGGIKDTIFQMKDAGVECELGATNVGVRTQGVSQGSIGLYRDIVIIGGTGVNLLNPSSSVELFSWSTMQWTFLPQTTSARCFSSSFVYKEQIIVHGGVKSYNIEALNMLCINNGWKKLKGRLPQQMVGHASIVHQDCLFLFGGENDGQKKFEGIYKMHLYPPYSFTLVCCMPEQRVHHGAELFGDKVVIVGGTTTGHFDNCLDTVLEYNITENTCRYLPRLPYAVSEMATVAWEDNVVVIGGEDYDDEPLDTVVVYNITDGTSTMLPSMKEKRSRCSAVITGNMLVVMGGWNDSKGNLDSVEKFSFNLRSWESLAPMNERRQAATAVLKHI